MHVMVQKFSIYLRDGKSLAQYQQPVCLAIQGQKQVEGKFEKEKCIKSQKKRYP